MKNIKDHKPARPGVLISATVDDAQKQEILRYVRENDMTGLYRIANESRLFLGFEEAEPTDNLKECVDGKEYIGYYRMYYRNGSWYGQWMYADEKVFRSKTSDASYAGCSAILEVLFALFSKGCDYTMKEYLKQFEQCSKNRYFLKPLYSDHYRILFDTTYGNEDYPVRIYLYE